MNLQCPFRYYNFLQIKMMCPMGEFCLQRKPNVAYEFAIFTGTCHSILQQDLNM